MLVRVPLKITLDGSVVIELEDGERLSKMSVEEIEARALASFEDDYEGFLSTAEAEDLEPDGSNAYVIDDDDDEEDDEEDDDFDDDFWNECLEDDEEGEE